jgi:uncharacterized membrane protein
MSDASTALNRRPLLSAGLLLGIGLGGLVDGIIAQQLLQLHSMMSGIYPNDSLANMQINMFWNGVFNLFVLAMAMIGVVMLYLSGREPRVPWSGRVLWGGMLMGWGVFNLVEGLLVHHVLGAHHVMDRLGLSAWDFAYLAWGAAMVLVGYNIGWRPARMAGHSTPAFHH